jgi:hypothetical protein
MTPEEHEERVDRLHAWSEHMHNVLCVLLVLSLVVAVVDALVGGSVITQLGFVLAALVAVGNELLLARARWHLKRAFGSRSKR